MWITFREASARRLSRSAFATGRTANLSCLIVFVEGARTASPGAAGRGVAESAQRPGDADAPGASP